MTTSAVPRGWGPTAQRMSAEEVRATQLVILEKFAEFCRQYELRFYLYAGTLLGAVRHKGFIPWDDDIDVAMPRQDYERLCGLSAALAAMCGFSIKSTQTCPAFPFPFAKVADDGTLIEEKLGPEFPIGINIDVFPLDGWPDGRVAQMIFWAKLRLFRGLAFCYPAHVRRGRLDARERLLAMVEPLVRRIPIETRVGWLSRSASRHTSETSSLVGVTVCCVFERVAASNYGGVGQLEFEGQNYPVPPGYDAVLTAMYGDYMRLPDPTKRVAPHPSDAYRLATSSAPTA